MLEYGLGEDKKAITCHSELTVLILIMLEYGLGGLHKEIAKDTASLDVLILIMLEYGLGVPYVYGLILVFQVLILIMLEYGLGVATERLNASLKGCLNPYYAGIWSRRSLKAPRHLQEYVS